MGSSFGSISHQRQQVSVDTPKLKFKRRFRLVLEATGVPHKAVAIEAGIDPGFLSRAIRDEHDEAIHAHHLPALTRELGSGLMEWLAVQCGGVYIHGGESSHIEDSPGILTGMLAHEVGGVVKQVFQDLVDGEWSTEERTSRIPALRKIEMLAKSLREDAEEGVQ